MKKSTIVKIAEAIAWQAFQPLKDKLEVQRERLLEEGYRKVVTLYDRYINPHSALLAALPRHLFLSYDRDVFRLSWTDSSGQHGVEIRWDTEWGKKHAPHVDPSWLRVYLPERPQTPDFEALLGWQAGFRTKSSALAQESRTLEAKVMELKRELFENLTHAKTAKRAKDLWPEAATIIDTILNEEEFVETPLAKILGRHLPAALPAPEAKGKE